MSEVTLKINGRGYSLTCDEGQEHRLLELGDFVNSRLYDIAAAGAATSESHLLVLTSLVMADEVFELRQEVAALQNQVRFLEINPPQGMASEDETLIAHAIDHLANKIQSISNRLEKTEKEAA